MRKFFFILLFPILLSAQEVNNKLFFIDVLKKFSERNNTEEIGQVEKLKKSYIVIAKFRSKEYFGKESELISALKDSVSKLGGDAYYLSVELHAYGCNFDTSSEKTDTHSVMYEGKIIRFKK
jgi:hypothetical protein